MSAWGTAIFTPLYVGQAALPPEETPDFSLTTVARYELKLPFPVYERIVSVPDYERTIGYPGRRW